jgi:Phosphotransferase enzyme family
VPLSGGISTPGIVRVGGTVRRPLKADADFTQRLLLHLERCGFAGAPRYLGLDERGRAILSYIDGFAPPHNGFPLTEAAVRAGARLVRTVHDLTEGTPFAAGAEVACHPNPSQPNFIFRDMLPIAIIDWDGTRPGTRLSNLGEFLWAFVHPAVYGDGEPAARMLRAAVDEYGCPGAGLVDAMLDPVRRFVHDNPEAGDWGLGELDYMERNAELFEAFLTRSSFPRRSGRMPLTE